MTFRLRVLIRRLFALRKEAKNTIKIKCSSVFFSSFINTIGWSALLLFPGLGGLNNQFSNWWGSIDGPRNSCQFVKMIFME